MHWNGTSWSTYRDQDFTHPDYTEVRVYRGLVYAVSDSVTRFASGFAPEPITLNQGFRSLSGGNGFLWAFGLSDVADLLER